MTNSCRISNNKKTQNVGQNRNYPSLSNSTAKLFPLKRVFNKKGFKKLLQLARLAKFMKRWRSKLFKKYFWLITVLKSGKIVSWLKLYVYMSQYSQCSLMAPFPTLFTPLPFTTPPLHFNLLLTPPHTIPHYHFSPLPSQPHPSLDHSHLPLILISAVSLPVHKTVGTAMG